MDNNQSCSANKGDCGSKKSLKCLIPVAAVFAVIFGWQWFFHGTYMMPQYEATASMWRSKEEMEKMLWVCITTKLLMAFAISCLYCCMAKGAACGGKCPKTGAKFGFKIGLLLGAHDYATYIWLPISREMAASWFVGDVIMGVLIGVVLAFLCRMCKKGECNA